MKWIKIQNVLKEICNRNVEIMVSTEIPLGLRSVVEFDNNNVVIYMQALYAKNIHDVTDTVIHEITHVKLGNNKHGNEFDVCMQGVKKEFIERMEKHAQQN